ncbi:MAG: hypoxanthine phosphoribosyltransferase [Chloroflexi bacterium]|nr:hypoxanthine phosphoribosyltransferase [Chloroflexota bacterium]
MIPPESLPVVVTAEQLQAAVARLAQQISNDYAGKDLVLLGVLKGSYVFLADLTRALAVSHQVDFIRVASYGAGTTSSGRVRLLAPLKTEIRNRHVLVVEDIVDSGVTMQYLLAYLGRRRPASLRVCAMFMKEGRTTHAFPVDYLGMIIPDQFVVGYGLDHAEDYRNLPDLRVLE